MKQMVDLQIQLFEQRLHWEYGQERPRRSSCLVSLSSVGVVRYEVGNTGWLIFGAIRLSICHISEEGERRRRLTSCVDNLSRWLIRWNGEVRSTRWLISCVDN